jgi:glutamyl-tRNA synthetase
MNGVYLRSLNPEELVKPSINFLDRDLSQEVKRPLDVDYVRRIILLIQERVRTLAEVPQLSEFFFVDKLEYDASLLLGKIERTEAIKALTVAVSKLEKLGNWDTASLETVLRPLAEELNLKTGVFFGLLRVATTGRTAAPPLFQTMEVLGRERCLKRSKTALDKLSASDVG